MQVLAVIGVLTLSLSGCSRSSGGTVDSKSSSESLSPITAPDDIERNLRAAMINPSGVVVVIDDKDLYWAISNSGIKDVSKNQITLKEGTRIAAGSGKGTPKEIAELLAQQRSGSGGYFFANSGETSITGQAGDTKKVITIEIKELVLSRKG
jgi:hypothetical protein